MWNLNSIKLNTVTMLTTLFSSSSVWITVHIKSNKIQSLLHCNIWIAIHISQYFVMIHIACFPFIFRLIICPPHYMQIYNSFDYNLVQYIIIFNINDAHFDHIIFHRYPFLIFAVQYSNNIANALPIFKLKNTIYVCTFWLE